MYGKIVATLNNRQGFGEKALLEKNPKNAKRGATILACSFVECIIIMRKQFLVVLESFSKETREKEKTLFPLFPFLLK